MPRTDLDRGNRAAVEASMTDYEQARADFDWEAARSDLDGPTHGFLNIAHEAVDRHALGPNADRIALRWLSRDGETTAISYASLRERTNRLAGVLREVGCQPGDGVATLAGRVPDLYTAALGTLKAGCVFTPLFSAFGPEPVRQRLDLGRIKVLVTTAALYRRKVKPIRERLTGLEVILLIGDDGPDGEDPTVRPLGPLLRTAGPDFDAVRTQPDDPALLHFTSGTTGTPKGVLHVHDAVVSQASTGRQVLDLHPGDRYWCTADPGWVTGTVYGIISPLVNGATSIVDGGDFDPTRWYGIVAEQAVEVWYTAPTAFRMLARAGADLARAHDLSSLRLVASVGEPLDAESVRWGQRTFDVPILDNWWQTETGSIMIANYRAEPVRPGSMGRPVPGIEATVLRRVDGELALDADSRPIEADVDEPGELALRAGWPSMFRTYLDREERYRTSFVDGWYRSGDLAKRDADGYYWFVGRGDDVIKSAGHLIGPFEVESALDEHPAVVEAGVIGKPDETAGQIVKAFVVLATGYEASEELRRDLIGHARRLLGPAVAPREIDFADALPHTRSGKIMRRLLKARELGLDEGDTSTLEGAP